MILSTSASAALVVLLLASAPAAPVDVRQSLPSVSHLQTPNHGLQPQAALDANGRLHLIYFQGNPKQGDLYYVRQAHPGAAFTPPVRVNDQQGTAIAIGTIRGGQLSLGQNHQVHVVWNGAHSADNHSGAPLFYARLRPDGKAFEAQRDLIHHAVGLDGGGSVAADGEGNVYVAWHGRDRVEGDEEVRGVFLAKSADGGGSFSTEKRVSPEGTGACACCSLRVSSKPGGQVNILYRAAHSLTNREMVLLVSTDRGEHFRISHRDPWVTAVCPMSSSSLNYGPDGLLAAWETAGQVKGWMADSAMAPTFEPPGAGARKHPVITQNSHGETLLVWAEGTGWEKGGAVGWQLFGKNGALLPVAGRREGIPAWSLPAAVSQPDGNFLIIH